MTRFYVALLLAPLALGACKKKAPEAAPEPAPAAVEVPAVSVSFGAASFEGTRAEGTTGTLTVPVTIAAGNDPLDIKVVSVTVTGADDACKAKTTVGDKLARGMTKEVSVTLTCAYKSIPEGDLQVTGKVIYGKGEDEGRQTFDRKVTFTR